ncbi:hypothetical protein [Rouxiella sp. Mn2063]|uniref:hypothetical protein n=1 Tax=Rouxiella sp. Mn2063 TaxID=3395262 RepID=UPI003BC5D525
MTVISINQAKQQRERDEERLKLVIDMREQCRKTLRELRTIEAEIVNRLVGNERGGGDAA